VIAGTASNTASIGILMRVTRPASVPPSSGMRGRGIVVVLRTKVNRQVVGLVAGSIVRGPQTGAAEF
jgi:hypothetical protein